MKNTKVRWWGALVLVASGAAWLGGQVSDRNGSTVSGKAVDSVTGMPVAKGQISLRPVGKGGGMTSQSDSNGTFVFTNVGAGRYSLGAVVEGYGLNYYGATGAGLPGRVLNVSVGHDVTSLDFRLTPLGVIAGKVVNPEGEPATRVSIACGLMDDYGAGPIMDTSYNVTNDRGEYRCPNLPPGKYYIQAVPPLPRPEAKGEAQALPTYYPASATLDAAVGVAALPGQDTSGITITLREGPVYRIRGKVFGPLSIGPITDLQLYVMSGADRDVPGYVATAAYTRALATRVGGLSAVRTDGSFELVNVERGHYEVVAVLPTSRSPVALGRAAVTVREQDVEGLTIQLGNVLDVDWTVRLDGAEWKDATCWFMLNSADGDYSLQNYSGTVQQDGKLHLGGVVPGKYYITAGCQQRELYIKSARFKDGATTQDILETGLDLSGISGRAEIEAVLSRGSGTVAGIVTDGDEPAPGKWVVLVPEPAVRWGTPRLRSGPSDDGGKFLLEGVAPGQYRLYAWLRASNANSVIEPVLLKRYETQAVKVEVVAGQAVTADAKLVRP